VTDDVVADYGWSTDRGPPSCGYITPRVVEILARLRVRRVLDLGSGNGALCAELARAGYDVAGVDRDRQGV